MNTVDGFVDDCHARGLTDHTIETYCSCITDYLRYHHDPAAVGLNELRAYLGSLRSRGLQGSTLKSYFAAISAFYDYMMFEGTLENNPIPSFRKRYLRIKAQHGGENTRQPGSIEQMKELVSLASREILAKTMILFLAKTGLRRGEFIAMDLYDLDLERMEFRVKAKAKRSNRLGFIDHELVTALWEYLDWREPLAKTDALWITPGGYRISRNLVYNTVTQYAKISGLHDPRGSLNKKFTPHCCRHFFTTQLRRAGMKREFIKELRGDRRGDAVDIYDHIDPEELRRSYLEYVPRLGAGPGRPGTLEEWIC
ncbi:MAG: tyrosine-type recombinase/integrase [Methanolobus sp.]|nr:tyrosine-type recombinase/integrase [Methanolobus sp.]